MAASEWRFFRSRRLRWPHGAIWMSFYVLLCIVGQNFCCEEESLAASLKKLCFCHNKHTLHCQGINDTHLFKTTPQSSFQGNLFVWKKVSLSLDQPVTKNQILESAIVFVVISFQKEFDYENIKNMASKGACFMFCSAARSAQTIENSFFNVFCT